MLGWAPRREDTAPSARGGPLKWKRSPSIWTLVGSESALEQLTARGSTGPAMSLSRTDCDPPPRRQALRLPRPWAFGACHQTSSEPSTRSGERVHAGNPGELLPALTGKRQGSSSQQSHPRDAASGFCSSGLCRKASARAREDRSGTHSQATGGRVTWSSGPASSSCVFCPVPDQYPLAFRSREGDLSGLPRWSRSSDFSFQCRRCGFDPWSGS